METWGPTLRGGAPGRPGKVREDDVEEEDKVPVAEVVVGGERTSGTETGCGVDDDWWDRILDEKVVAVDTLKGKEVELLNDIDVVVDGLWKEEADGTK